MGRGARTQAAALPGPDPQQRNRHLHEVLVAAVARTIRPIPTQVELDEGDGMPVPCAVNLDNLLMMPLSQLTERVCGLSGDRMAAVCTAPDVATEC